MTLQTPYIKIDELGIDLIKNYQVYRHLEYREINQIEMKRGHLIRNWWIPLTLGILTIIGALFLGILAIENIDLHNEGIRSFRSSLMLEISPWLLLIGGLILTYQAISKSEIIIISTNLKKYQVALKEFEKENRIQEVMEFLGERTKVKRA
jgi:hypothetical protein